MKTPSVVRWLMTKGRRIRRDVGFGIIAHGDGGIDEDAIVDRAARHGEGEADHHGGEVGIKQGAQADVEADGDERQEE